MTTRVSEPHPAPSSRKHESKASLQPRAQPDDDQPNGDQTLDRDQDRGGSFAWLPLAWCNLRRNPFGELTRQERIELAVVKVDAIMARLPTSRHAVQLIGDCGRGKTTRMLVLAASLPDASYVYLPEDEPCPGIPEGSPLLIDEAQRLPRRVRRTVFDTGLPLVLATHTDLRRPLKRAGYQVHTEEIGGDNDANLIVEVMNRRIDSSRLDDGPVPRFTTSDAVELLRRFGSDVRGMEGYLYERVQAQVFSHGEMRFVD